MSGIPVYTQSPINAASKASGVTPQTTTPQVEASPTAPHAVPAATTTTPTPAYHPARPGAAAAPAPTENVAQRYMPLQPTKTISSEVEGPPAPQAGSVPTPSSRRVPPPPKANEVYRPEQTPAPQQSGSTQQPLPPQLSIPAPTMPMGAQHPLSSTSTSNTASSSYPVQIEHPPGYQQNVNASEQTSEQRRAQEASNPSGFGWRESAENSSGMDSDGSSVWDTAKKWAQQTGEKLSEAEAEVWRKINKE